MNDVSDKVVILTLVLTIAVSLGGATMILTKLSSMSGISHMTGFATDGQVQINISETAAYNITDNSIDFGTCDTGGLAQIVSINSEMTNTTINTTTGIQCTTSSLPDNFTIKNVGNTNITLDVTTDLNGSQILNTPGGRLAFRMTDPDGRCVGTLTDTYTELDGTNPVTLCDDMEKATPFPKIYLWANFTIPPDSSTGGTQETATLTFTVNSAT